MSGGLEVLKLQEEDITKMLAATTHIGSENSETTMEQYIFKRRPDGVNIINLRKTWEKLMLAARAIAAIEIPSDVFVVSSRQFGQRGVLKFARYIGATPIAGRFTPGAFTNQIQVAFREPRLLVVADPRADHQPVTESSYANIPIIAFCNVDSPTKFIDMCIPCNNKSPHSLGLMWWFLAREVLKLKGSISQEQSWDVMPDLFFYRDPEEAEKEEQARKETLAQAQAAAATSGKQPAEDWEGGGMDNDWSNEPAPVAAVIGGAVPPPPPPLATATATAAAMKFNVQEDWNQQPPPTSDWAAETAAPASAPVAPSDQSKQWGGSANWN